MFVDRVHLFAMSVTSLFTVARQSSSVTAEEAQEKECVDASTRYQYHRHNNWLFQKQTSRYKILQIASMTSSGVSASAVVVQNVILSDARSSSVASVNIARRTSAK